MKAIPDKGKTVITPETHIDALHLGKVIQKAKLPPSRVFPQDDGKFTLRLSAADVLAVIDCMDMAKKG